MDAHRILYRLEKAETSEPQIWFRQDYRQAWICVALASRDEPQPFIESCYRIYGCHPDQVFNKITRTRLAKLAKEYPDWYDEAGNPRTDRLDIPDYDPTCGRACGVLSWGRPLESNPVNRWAKAPLRKVVNRIEVFDDGKVVYHFEELECGHTHSEPLGANPGKRRRRCRLCATAGVDIAKTKPSIYLAEQAEQPTNERRAVLMFPNQELRNANVEQAGSVRRTGKEKGEFVHDAHGVAIRAAGTSADLACVNSAV